MNNILPKEFSLPMIKRPTDDSLVLWISGRARQGESKRIEDLSRYKNTGDIVGASWVNTPLNHSCLSFDGVDDVVSIADSNSTLDLPNDFTIVLWLNPVLFATNNDIISKGVGADDSAYNWFVSVRNTGQIDFIAGTSACNVRLIDTTTGVDDVIRTNKWNHLVVMKEGTFDKIFIDGTLRITGTNAAGTNCQDNNPVRIGKTDGSGQINFNGVIDEIRIYSRALSASEILQLYEETKYFYGY